MSAKQYITTENQLKLGRKTAFVSFLLGTGILVLYYFFSSFEMLAIGFVFIVLTFLVNIKVLISILIRAYRDKENRSKAIRTSLLMLLNIPAMFLYIELASILSGFMRITFTNTTMSTVSNVDIVGGEGGYIDKLEPGESETVWVKLTTDNQIGIYYLSNGQPLKEAVTGYLLGSEGKRIHHDIDGIDNLEWPD